MLKPISYFLILIALLLLGCDNEKQAETVDKETKEIKEYYIECGLTQFDSIQTHFRQNIYIPIKISFNGETTSARMRVRGDTSREDPKKSLKIKCDSTQIKGLPSIINLNAEYADKTYIRQYLSTLLMKKSGQTCYNTEHVKVFLNGNFLGLFLQVENMDKYFLARNGLDEKGNLYKATKDGACLSIFDDFDKKWEKKTNKKSDHNDLTKLIYDINHTPDGKFKEFISQAFNYDEFINILALNMFLSNSSTYYHNYYLYHDIYGSGKWKLLPWDMDKTLSYYNWMPYTYHRTSSEWESDNPLVERSILCEPIFNDIQNRIKELKSEHLNNKVLTPLVDSLTNILSDIIPLDTTDKIKSIEEWKKYANGEKQYFDNHFQLLQKQITQQPHSFKVHRLIKDQTQKVTFRWQKSKHPQSKDISYIVSYGTDFLLQDSSKTKFVTGIKDTFYTLPKLLNEGEYYWKITAFDGEFYTDGFNTKNIFTVKKGSPLPKVISSNKTLTKEHSPYIATKTTTIKKGVTLTLEKGVEIHIPQDGTIECSGNLIANGTEREPIKLLPDNASEFWDYIYFYEPSEVATLNHVIIKNGTINCKNTALTLNKCKMIIDKKEMGEGSKRKVLIYTSKSVVRIKNSFFRSNGFGEGMVLFNSDIITENCYFDNTPDAIEYINVDGGIIRNNYVTRSPDDAIDLNNCDNILIENNFLIENKDKAISIGTEQYGASIKNIQVKNNLIVKNKTAIAIKDSSIAYISNNTLFKNKYGINLYKKREDYNIGGKALVKNTIFEKNEKTNVYPDEWSEATVRNCIVTNKYLAGKNNLKGDPKFIDAGNNNFHLKEGSPCINKGDDGNNIGAFSSTKSNVSLTKIHIKSNKENDTGDWIELSNNYNIPFNLSKFKLFIVTESKDTSLFVFPVGTILEGLDTIILAKNYYKYTIKKAHKRVLGALPKLKNKTTKIILLDQHNNLIDKVTYKAPKTIKEDLTWVLGADKKWLLDAK